jgi:hypothetical protein
LLQIRSQPSPLELLRQQIGRAFYHEVQAAELLDGVIAVRGNDTVKQLLVLAEFTGEFVEDGYTHVIAAPAEAGHGSSYGHGAELIGECVDIAIDAGYGIGQVCLAGRSDFDSLTVFIEVFRIVIFYDRTFLLWSGGCLRNYRRRNVGRCRCFWLGLGGRSLRDWKLYLGKYIFNCSRGAQCRGSPAISKFLTDKLPDLFGDRFGRVRRIYYRQVALACFPKVAGTDTLKEGIIETVETLALVSFLDALTERAHRCVQDDTQIRLDTADSEVDDTVDRFVIRDIAAAVVLDRERGQIIAVHQADNTMLNAVLNDLQALRTGGVIEQYFRARIHRVAGILCQLPQGTGSQVALAIRFPQRAYR